MSDIREKLKGLLREDNHQTLLSYRGDEWLWSHCARIVASIDQLLSRAGIESSVNVGLIARNRPPHAAVILGMIALDRRLTMVHVYQSPEALAQDVKQLQLGVVVGDSDDWTSNLSEMVEREGVLGIVLPSERGSGCSAVGDYRHSDDHRRTESNGFEVLSSGTTGTPSRTIMPFTVVQRALDSILAVGPEVARSAEIVSWPFGTIGGLCQVVTASVLTRPFALLEKFNLDEWLEAIDRYQPMILFVQPAVLRIVLDAAVPKERLSCLQVISGGAGPLEPELQRRFEERYGIPLLWAYGATEFCGTIISWTFELRKQFGLSKAGSAGKPISGVEVRVVDVTTEQPLPPGDTGWLEAKVSGLSADWVRTTDLAAVDEDGFVFIKGRGDGSINRGGFKVLPEQVVDCLRTHPAVLDAAVVGIDDKTLGQVPVAAIELARDAQVSVDELDQFVRGKLLAYQVPAQWKIVESLPRTSTLKVKLTEIARLFP